MTAPHEPRLARVAALVADPARSRMLAHLMDGEYASASELAKAASVTAATASGHLAKLLDAQFVVCELRGRHRYYRLHLAGQLADELYRHFIAKGWLCQGSGRAVEVTATGHRDLLPCLSESAA